MSDENDGTSTADGSVDDESADARDDGDGETEDSRDAQFATFVELAVVALSVVLTLSLFGFAAFQLVAAPASGPPHASVVGTHRADGRLVATVVVSNPRERGLRRATARVTCRRPPVRVRFSNVPARGRKRVQVVCPGNASRPRATLVSWRAL